MRFLIKAAELLTRHEEALHQIAEYEANSLILKLGLQLGRLRTAKEQLELLTLYYNETLAVLKGLDESGAYQFPLMLQMLPDAGMDVEQLSDVVNKFGSFIGVTGQLEQIDFSQIESVELNAIPIDHPVYEILKSYKEYLTQQDFLERIKELMDLSEAHNDGEKLSPEELKEVKDEKGSHLTAAQKVLALYYLMRWSGIELGQRQGARQQRFISSLTGISVGTVKEKFPTLNVTGKPYHLDNLKAIVPLFESVDASKLVEKIQSDIAFEQEERGL